MSEFLTAGFTLHFIKDILDKIQTGCVMIDFMITGAVIMCMNRDIRTFLNNYIVVNNLSYFYCRCFHNQIEYRLSSIRKTNYEGSFNICHEKIFSICEYINTRIKNEDRARRLCLAQAMCKSVVARRQFAIREHRPHQPHCSVP